MAKIERVPRDDAEATACGIPIDGVRVFKELGIERLVLLEKENQLLALMGIGVLLVSGVLLVL